MRCQAVIVAAGQGTRFGAARPKQLLPLAGRPLLIWALDAFRRAEKVQGVVLVVSEEARAEVQELLDAHGVSEGVALQLGGAQRVDSVERGLAALGSDIELVAVHDAARALVSPELIDRVVEQAERSGAALAALPARDTIKQAGDTGLVERTLDRGQIWLAQTPQVTRLDWLREALAAWRAQAKAGSAPPTDEAQLLELAGRAVQLVEGATENFKITVPNDLALAEAITSARVSPRMPRVGVGHDVHRLVEGRDLVLGGVTIPFDRGLEGHSDADVLAHAIGDALLGAAALGDLGEHFPPNDPRFAGADSLALLKQIGEMVRQAGYLPQSIDSVLICQRPRLAPFVPAMRQRLADALGIEVSRVSVKATTTEGLGFTGREEGIAAQATAVIG